MNHDAFDYVIVGAGSAGCILASRLSEDPAVTVALLEAGGKDSNPLISIPIGMGKLHQHGMYQWGDSSEPEPLLANRRMPVTHARVIGGSASINMMAYTRGHASDYNRWASEGAPGWSYADVLPYFKKSETWTGGPADAYRGDSGPVGTQWAKTRDPIYEAWIKAGEALQFPYTPDYNGARSEGFGRGQYTIRDGRRSSTAKAYLKPARARRNLTIITNAYATRITCDAMRASGVEYVRHGRQHTVEARADIIVSSGAINSPHLLMLSGIGPQEHLARLGIKTIVDLPVGMNLQDHFGVPLNWERRGTGSFHESLRLDRAAANVLRAWFSGTGPATSVPGGLHAFIKSQPDVDVADIEIMFHTAPPQADVWFPGLKPAYTDGYGIRPTLMRPKSRGRLTLRSTDAEARPLIHYHALSDERDRHALREGFKRAQELGNSSELTPFRGKLTSPGKTLQTDSEIDDYIANTASAMLHPAGTCKMGSDDTCVVTPDLKVRGIDGLRVVDASIMPDLVSAHINAAIIMIAEKASDIIVKARREAAN
jgi:choline dehydrogenase-like flavoprotein